MSQFEQLFEPHVAGLVPVCRIRAFVCLSLQAALAVMLISTAGCGGAAETPQGSGDAVSPDSTAGDAGASNPGSETPSTDPTSKGNSAVTKRGRDEVWVDANGQKWFGNVPMDAFFDQPYSVASNTTPLAGAPATAVVSNLPAASLPETTPTTEPSTTSDTPATETDGDAWGDLISAQALDDEVKTIRNFLNENLQSVGTYNSSMLMIPPKAATLGALAGVAVEHSGAITWKDDATYIRNLAKQMNSDTLRSGPKDQKRLLELYEAISDTLNRSRPASAEPLPESDGFAEVSEMRLLMHRMEEAEKRMKQEAGSDSAMTSRKDMIAQESSVLATLAKIVTLPGYGYEDDPAFKGYANEVVKSALAMKTAAESNDFASYELSMTRVSTTCSNCHSDYKNN